MHKRVRVAKRLCRSRKFAKEKRRASGTLKADVKCDRLSHGQSRRMETLRSLYRDLKPLEISDVVSILDTPKKTLLRCGRLPYRVCLGNGSHLYRIAAGVQKFHATVPSNAR